MPRSELELFTSSNVLGEVVEVDGLLWVEIVAFDRGLVKIKVRFDPANFMGKVVMIEEIEIGVGF